MRQQSFTDNNFEKFRKKTRKELFLDDMERIIPWQELTAAIEPFYPKPRGAGRRPIGIERMLRIHFLQHWFALSDPGAEEALYDSRAMRSFVGIDLSLITSRSDQSVPSLCSTKSSASRVHTREAYRFR